MISREDVEHVALLARLGLSEDEAARMQEQLSRILAAVAALREVDTSAVGPTAQVIELENVMRADEPRPPLEPGAVLANAPLAEEPFVRVPTVLEEGR
jgi:aspartyl-tRNA(Asn)/glutamyl-tRNA(Gln) amidotransferase subunit C